MANANEMVAQITSSKLFKAMKLKYTLIIGCLFLITLSATCQTTSSSTWQFRDDFMKQLVKNVPSILADQETTSGQFGSGVWIVHDQHVIYPLAAAWSREHPANPYYHDAKVLESIMDGGDALINAQNAKGMWIFRKKDNSTWGDIYMPWTYSRWIRTFSLIKDAMPADRRARWEKALLLGYNGIARDEVTTHVHNIPVHHAMGLYCAGRVFDRKDWRDQASAFIHKAVEMQTPDGYWSENVGPVVGYNFVYVDAIGVYYALSKDERVLPALDRAAVFHTAATYPNGTYVETIDERQVYYAKPAMGSVGFSHTPKGRAYIKRQYDLLQKRGDAINAEMAGTFLLYGQEGELAAIPALGAPTHHTFQDKKALFHGEGDWFTCLSAYTAPVPPGRWIQDRQNLVSLFHKSSGLIVGGGNTKLQPLWSTFTVGDISLLKHKPGDRSPNFLPPNGLWHVPDEAEVDSSEVALRAKYDGAKVSVKVDTSGEAAKISYHLDQVSTYPTAAHVPLMPRMGKPWKTASGKSGDKLTTDSITLKAGEAGEWFEHDNYRIVLPPQATVTWPALPHNQYRIDGAADAEEGKIVITLPLDKETPKLAVEVRATKR